MGDKVNRENSLPTSELWAQLFHSSSVNGYLDTADDRLEMPQFSEYITSLADEKHIKPEAIIKRGGIESSFGHRLFLGTRNPSRDTVLQFAFGFELDVDQTQRLLKVARATALHPRVKRDAVIAYCLHHHKSFLDTQELLYENKLPLIGGKRNGA